MGMNRKWQDDKINSQLQELRQGTGLIMRNTKGGNETEAKNDPECKNKTAGDQGRMWKESSGVGARNDVLQSYP